MDHDVCQVTVIHEEMLAKARLQKQSSEEVAAQAGFYKLLGDPTRLRLLQALVVTEMCVCDLAALLDSTMSAVSHQLRLLRTAGLVRFRKEGKWSITASPMRDWPPFCLRGRGLWRRGND